MSIKIILFENQIVIKNIKNKFGDTNKKYLNLQNIKLKKLSVKQVINIQNWRMAAIKGCTVVSISAVITEKGRNDYAKIGVTCD